MSEYRSFKGLIVSQSEKTTEALKSLLSDNQFSSIIYTTDAGKARREAFDKNVDIVIINTPLPDDFGVQLSMDLAEKNLGVLLFVKNDIYNQVSYKVEQYGVVTLPKPISRPALVQSLKILKAMRMKMARLEARNQTLEMKMKEIRLINRAKWILIDQLRMSEEEAHKYIEKTAMDECVSRGVIAENIIKTYEM